MPEPTAPGAARPVTPVAIAAGLLDSAVRRLEASGADTDVLADLRHAHALTAGLDAYVARCTSPASPALEALERRTNETDWRPRAADAGTHLEQEMLSGHVEGRLLRMLVAMTAARSVLEVGMFTGYSALAMAEALPDDGRLVACEIDPATAAFARDCFDASPAGERIEVAVGPAADTLARLAAEGRRFDLVFVDADKTGYAGYLEAVLGGDEAPGLLSENGTVCVDNTLLQGEPWGAVEPGANGRAVADFNAAVAADPRVEQVLVPLRDGVTLLRRV